MVTLLQAHCISLPHDTAPWTSIVFTRVLSQLRVLFCLQWMAKLSNMSASSFAWSSVNKLPEPLKCFIRLLENILYVGQRFLNGIHVSRPVECQLKMRTFRVTEHQQNDRKCWDSLILFNINLFLLTLWPILIFAVMLWDAWKNMWDEKDWTLA
jgi:hypothetical protein